MTTVRQTVTTLETSHGAAPGLDNSLDALLEDLQSSVARGGGGAVNGLGPGGGASRSYREVTRTMQRERSPQVMHLSPANPTTVVAERAASPLLGAVAPGEQRSMMYKTVSYQTYHSSAGGTATAGGADPAADARLQQNLNELDSLLVDLRHAQRTGFDPPKAITGGSATSTRTEMVTTGGSPLDRQLMEPLGHSTPAPPARQPTPTQQHVSRAVEYRTYRNQQYGGGQPQPQPQHQYGTIQPQHGGSPARYTAPDSPRLQPKRSSSAQRELVYGSEHVSRRRTRSPSPSTPPRREFVETRERYREKSPTNQRLQREMHISETMTNRSASAGSGGRYRERDPSPGAGSRRAVSSSPAPGSPGPGGSRVTTVRTYNYSTTTSGGGGGSPVPAPAPSPAPAPRPASPQQRPPYRSPSPVSFSRPPVTGEDSPLPRRRSPSPARYHSPPQRYGPPGRFPTDEEEPLVARPFPSVSPTPPGREQPPKRLEELMATFDSEQQQQQQQRGGPPGGYYRTTTVTTTSSSHDVGGGHRGPPAPVLPPVTNGTAVVPAANAKAAAVAAADAGPRAPTTNAAGPPVYYPPGVEMFAQKEDASMQMSGKAHGKGKYKYEYESKEKSKSSQSSGGAVVPVCLPLCCAMPCVIM